MSLKREILIVEDNEINREILGGLLEEDYRVLKAENGLEALEILKEHGRTVSLILLDVMMPVMDGYTFLDRIKQDETLALIPVIVTTQGNSEEDELAALAHGATDFVPKPYRPRIILHRVAGLIKLRENAAMVNELQYDRLTGLYRKEFFYRQVRRRLLEDPEGKYCIIGSNVENFKLINDVYGVQEGDRLIQEIARVTREAVGSTGFCGRFGGDRLLVFQRMDRELADRQKFLDTARNGLKILGKSLVMRWGIYEITDPSVHIEQMCDRALLAADSIKSQYQKFFALYDDSFRDKLLREQAITSVMETALQEKQFLVYLQPQYALHGNHMSGAEALVRWIHPQWGFMSPGEFIPLFEKNGFIPKLDQYVRESVCALLRQWQDKGYPLVPISVNISRADVFQSDLTETIPALTQKYGISPSLLHLELTESAYTESPEKIINTIEGLRNQGFIVEMDDFGSGYSSLNMLSQISLDVLKLDLKFVQNECAKPVCQSILGDVISMAHRSRMEVVAEGVETREQMNRLRDEECDIVQGYFCARPMKVTEFEELLKTQSAEQVAEAAHRNLRRERILVADEDARYRETVRQAFSHFEILEAGSSAEALMHLTSGCKREICGVILSSSLPEKGAAVVMSALRASPIFWDVPVLATLPEEALVESTPLAMEADDFLYKSNPLFDLNRRLQRLIDTATLRRRESLLQDEANHDPLTGLLNRRGLQDALASIREKDMPLAICLFDLDDLKKANDLFGHDMGDRMLRAFAKVIESQTRTEDIKCRYGGDEFVVIFKHMGGVDGAKKRGDAICRNFREFAQQEGFSAACSVGITFCGPDERPSPELIARADRALYHAKRENKGSCWVWEKEIPCCE